MHTIIANYFHTSIGDHNNYLFETDKGKIIELSKSDYEYLGLKEAQLAQKIPCYTIAPVEKAEIEPVEEKNKEHGREEIRRYYTIEAKNIVPDELIAEWKGISIIGAVERFRKKGDTISKEISYYIGSISNDKKLFAKATRHHWHVENRLHWRLDVIFNEDHSRNRQGNATENFSILKHVAFNLLNKTKSGKLGMSSKRFRANGDDAFRDEILKNPILC